MEAGNIFVRFFILCTFAVGGLNTVMPGLFHYVVDEEGWLTARQFTDLYALGQAAPGPNALWVTLIGLQIASWQGALAAGAGLVGAPLALTLALGIGYAHFGTLPAVQSMLRGMGFVATGLVIANALGLSTALPRRPVPWLFVAAVFIAVALLHFPLVAVMAALGPVAVAITWAGRKRQAKGG